MASFSWSSIEFQLAFLKNVFEEPLSEGIPQIAARMIAGGFSTPSLDELAGLPQATDPQTVSAIVTRAGGELGYQRLDGSENRLAAGRLYLELTVVGVYDPYEAARSIWKTIYWHLPEEAQWDFSRIVALASEWEDEPGQRTELRVAILEATSELLANLNKYPIERTI